MDSEIIGFIKTSLEDIKREQVEQNKSIMKLHIKLSLLTGKVAATAGLLGAFSAVIANKLIG